MFGVFRLTTLVLALNAAACAHVPVMSLVKLSSIDFATTDLTELRAGIALPESLQPLEGTVKLTVLAETDDGMKIRRSFILEDGGTPDDLAGLRADAGADANVHVYRLSDREAGDMESVRRDVLARKQETGGGGRLEISIGAEACRTGVLPDGSLPMTTYLKTSETETFVPLTRNVDLRTLTARSEVSAGLPPCS
jgi:hypothetical protein